MKPACKRSCPKIRNNTRIQPYNTCVLMYMQPTTPICVHKCARIVAFGLQTKWYFRDLHRAPPPRIIHNNIWLPYRLLLVNVFSYISFHPYVYRRSARAIVYINIGIKRKTERQKKRDAAGPPHLTKGVIKNARISRVCARVT